MTPAREINRIGKAVTWNGNKEAFFYRIKSIGLNEKSADLLYRIYRLCTATEYVDEIAREVFSTKASYDQIVKNRGITRHKVNYYVYKSTKNIQRDLDGLRIVSQIFDNNIDQEYFDDISNRVDTLLDIYPGVIDKRIDDEFTINFFEGVQARKHVIDDEDFVNIRNKVTAVSKRYQQFMFINVDSKLLEYVVYLLKADTEKMDTEDKVRRANLLAIARIGV